MPTRAQFLESQLHQHFGGKLQGLITYMARLPVDMDPAERENIMRLAAQNTADDLAALVWSYLRSSVLEYDQWHSSNPKPSHKSAEASAE